MDKYASTTIDPVELIKKYHRSQKRGGNADQAKRKLTSKFQEAREEEEANRKYPTKFLHSEKAKTTTKAATNDAFPRYTTSASFRRKPSDDKSQSSATTKRYGHKLAVTERAGGEGGDSWWADLQRRSRWERLEERRREEELVKREKESRREERRKEERRQEDWRREEEKRRKDEEERRQDEIWAEQQRRESARRAAEARVELESQRKEDVRRRAGEGAIGIETSSLSVSDISSWPYIKLSISV